jgi:hypothetical protein
MKEIIAIKALTYSDAFQTNTNATIEGVLKPEEAMRIARMINTAINIPFLSESRELAVFEAAIRLVDKAISMHLPKDLLESVHNVRDGISNQEVANLEQRLTPIINQMINIPLIPEFVEERLISMILGIMLNAMRVGSNILSDETII